MFLSLLLSGMVWGANRHPIPAEDRTLVEISRNDDVSAVPNEFEMLIWNVHKGSAGVSWEGDLNELSRGADFVLLQEGMDDSAMTPFLRSLRDFNFWMATSFFYAHEGGRSTGVITGSRSRPQAVSYERSPGREPFWRTPKMALMSKHRLSNGTSLLLVNIHGINFVPNGVFQEQIRDLIPLIASFRGDVIFAGDFNTWNPWRLRFLKRSLRPLGLSQVAPHGSSCPFRLDHLFQRGCPGSSLRIEDRYTTSDHKPLRARMRCL